MPSFDRVVLHFAADALADKDNEQTSKNDRAVMLAMIGSLLGLDLRFARRPRRQLARQRVLGLGDADGFQLVSQKVI